MKKLVEESFREWRSIRGKNSSAWRRPSQKEINEFRKPIPALFIGNESEAIEKFYRYNPVDVSGFEISDFDHLMGDYPVFNNTLFTNVDKSTSGVQRKLAEICRRREDIVLHSWDEESLIKDLFACTKKW